MAFLSLIFVALLKMSDSFRYYSYLLSILCRQSSFKLFDLPFDFITFNVTCYVLIFLLLFIFVTLLNLNLKLMLQKQIL